MEFFKPGPCEHGDARKAILGMADAAPNGACFHDAETNRDGDILLSLREAKQAIHDEVESENPSVAGLVKRLLNNIVEPSPLPPFEIIQE